MDVWVLVTIAIIIGSIVLSAWKQISFSIVASVACVAIFLIMAVADTMGELEFMPRDLVDASRFYTVLTSMYTHFDFFHLFYNILGLAFIGIIFEQRIGTRPFILLYLLSGLAGTLAFAAIYWNNMSVAVIGASGAISGVLGGFARLFPNERMAMLMFFVPLPPMPIWIIVGIFVFIQVFFLGGTNIAIEAHLGGLAAGVILAPLVVRIPRSSGKMKRTISAQSLRRLAVTPELKSILSRIENEEVPDVRSAWIEHFISKAQCPHCGAKVVATRGGVRCERGHLL